MKKLLGFLLSATLLINTGCATMFDGKTQAITVNTSPPKANCLFKRNGQDVGDIEKTPGSAVIEKSRDDVTVVCNKKGYEESTYIDKSGVAAWTFVNILFGGVIGLAVDYGTGAINKYDSPVNMTLAHAEGHKHKKTDDDDNDD